MTSSPYRLDMLRTQLGASIDALRFYLDLVPGALLVDPVIPGHDWGVKMQLAHLAVYEDQLAAPVLDAMAEGANGREAAPSGSEDWFRRDAQALSGKGLSHILRTLRTARARQLQALERFDQDSFNRPLTPLWGELQPAGWVAAKTVQHTWEHGTPIMQTALFALR